MNNDKAQTAHNLMLSPTMERIDRFDQALPIDVHNKEDLNMVLKSVLLPLVFAVDDDQIIFNDANVRTMFHGLMAFAFEIITEGNEASTVKGARMH
jgi:hypothetical protein